MIKKAAVINDLSGFGKCSLTATIAILSVMGIQPCPMPTAVLTNQTGYKNHYCIDLTNELCRFEEMWSINEEHFDGIYSGFFSDRKQVDIVFDFIKKFRKQDTLVLVDPVMGDNGKLYSIYSNECCKKICSLAKSADIITPNLTELCILTDTDFDDLMLKCDEKDFLERICDIAKSAVSHSSQKVVVTGIKSGGFLINATLSDNDFSFAKSKCYGGSFSGTGDIFASIIFASLLNGENLVSAAEKATRFIEKATEDTVKEPYDRNDGINFEKFLYQLHE